MSFQGGFTFELPTHIACIGNFTAFEPRPAHFYDRSRAYLVQDTPRVQARFVFYGRRLDSARTGGYVVGAVSE